MMESENGFHSFCFFLPEYVEGNFLTLTALAYVCNIIVALIFAMATRSSDVLVC